MSIIVDTPEGIAFARLAAVKGALRLEAAGMRRRGRSALSIARAEGWTEARTAKAALVDLQALVDQALGR